MAAALTATLIDTSTAQAEIVAPPRAVRAVRTHEPMVIDGVGNEAVWREAPVTGDFTEREPHLGATPPRRTHFQIAYDDAALYALVRCEIPNGQIVVRTLRRDAFAVYDDDMVLLKIDPLHGKRTAYNFGVNADGTQVDMLVLEDADVMLAQWDGVWASEATRDGDGYTVEYRIPFAILGIEGGDSVEMGLNVLRVSVDPIAKYDWQLPLPPERFNSPSSFGTLTGLEHLEDQRALEFTPFVLGRSRLRNEFTLDPRAGPNLGAGGDLRVQVGTGSYVEGSVLTDFAQVEVDAVQVARDRFPLFFPEQRPFFINGLSVFNFGVPGSAQLFNTRTVGLDGGVPIPIAGGAKAYGTTGNLRYALLDVQTLRKLRDPRDPDSEAVPPENFTVGRARYALGPNAWVGAIGVSKQRYRQNHHDHLSGGIDGELRAMGRNLVYYGFVAGARTEHPPTPAELDATTGAVASPAEPRSVRSGLSAHSRLTHRTLLVRPTLAVTWSDEDFEPALGYYARTGVAQHDASVDLTPRPGRFGVRQLTLGPAGSLTSTPDYSHLLTRRAGGTFQVYFENNASIVYDYRHVFDEVREDFELYDMTVAADRYSGHTHSVTLGSATRQAVRVTTAYQHEQLFGGFTHTLGGTLTLRPSKYFALFGGYTHLVGRLDDARDRFDFGFSNASVEVNLSRNLWWDTLGRLTLEPGAERVGVQSRLRWRYLPGSDAFLVYRSDHPFARSGDGTSEPFYEITAKLNYYLRTLL